MSRATIILTALVLASACGRSPASPTSPASPNAPPTGANFPVTTMSYTSDPEDFVGRGRTQTFNLQTSTFQANVGRNGEYLSMVIRPITGVQPLWTMVIDASSPITPGTYQTARAYGSGNWFVDFSGDGRTCSRATGRIVVHAFDFNPTNLALKHFRASLEQRCEPASVVPLRAEIALLADPWR